MSEKAYQKEGCNTIQDAQQYKETLEFLNRKTAVFEQRVKAFVDDFKAVEKQYNLDESYYSYGKNGFVSFIRKLSDKEFGVSGTRFYAVIEKRNCFSKEAEKQLGKAQVDTINTALLAVLEPLNKFYGEESGKYSFYKAQRNLLYLYALRAQIRTAFNELVEDEEVVHISEFNKRISDILGDCSVPFIYERIGERYRHYFIDEFQDTSVLQWQNFLPLMENSLSFGNMNMIVGDAKQSIYRFRSGEVEQIINLPKIYKRPEGEFGLRCEEQFVSSAQKMTLGTNFRSSKNVIKFNNTFFRYAGRLLKSGDVYNDAEQVYDPQKPDGFVSVEVFHGEMKTAEYKEKVKASMLKQILAFHKQGVDYKDITILVRSNSDGTDIADYLVANGIEVLSAESVLLQSSDKVQLIVNTLKLMVDDKNTVTKLAVDHFGGRNVRPIVSTTPQNASYNIYDTCVQICKSNNFNILEDVFLQYFMNMVHEWQSRHSAGISDFLEFWEKKKSKLAVQITGDLDCVNIMTIHKAKGLEFKVVIYPYADTNLKSSFTQSEIWIQCADNQYTKDIPYLDAFLLKLSKEKLTGTIFEKLIETENNKTMLDNLDIMYVAMTRAKNMLFVYTNDKKPSEKSDNSYNLFTDFFEDILLDIQHKKNPSDDAAFDDFFVHNNEFGIVEGEEQTSFNYGNFDATLLNIKEKDTKDDEVKILELKEGEQASTTLNWFDKLQVDADPTMIWAEKGSFMPEEWGSLVHQILSKIKTIDDAERVLRPYVNDGTIDEEQAAKLLDTFRKVTDIPELKPAFSADAVVKNEMDIHTYDGRIIRPDRYAETPNGTILIDYKTGKAHEEYFNQLQDYTAALMQMNGNQSINAYLVYLGDEIKLVEVKMDRLF